MEYRLKRRQFLSALGGAAALSLAPRSQILAAKRPNVVFVFSDEHRYQSMSFTEMPAMHTPNMAAMARDGSSFTHCISNYPLCSPYRAILQTGRWPYQNGVVDNVLEHGEPLDPTQDTIGKAFRAAGYRTGYIGKWHLAGTRAEPYGYDHSLIWLYGYGHMNSGTYYPLEGEEVSPKGYNAEVMTDQALEFIDTLSGQPFFLMLSLIPPHADFLAAPPDSKALYPKGSLPFRPNYPTAQHGDKTRMVGKSNSWQHYQGYHAHISAVDDQLGRIMQKLDELGIAENTILVYTSDHGSMFGSHRVGSKRQPHEESIRVPFLVRWPGNVQAGAARKDLFGTIDIVPTLCALAGIDAPKKCGGRDFSAQLRGTSAPILDPQFIMHISKTNSMLGDRHPAPLFRGLRTEGFTFALQPDRPWILFDNKSDPYQLRNLIKNPSTLELQRALRSELLLRMSLANDPTPLPAI